MSILYDFAFIFVALFALGFTIFIHELGHFLAARQRGLVILRFSIGFGRFFKSIHSRGFVFLFASYIWQIYPLQIDVGTFHQKDP